MYKSILAIFFSSLFMVLLCAPTIVTLIDSDYDISILLDANEEEEKEGKEGKESSKDIEIKVLQISEDDTNGFMLGLSSVLGFYSNIYSSTHSELVSPPPEHNI